MAPNAWYMYSAEVKYDRMWSNKKDANLSLKRELKCPI